MDEKMARQLETNKKLIQQNDSKKITGEQRTRQYILSLAKLQGQEQKAVEILDKYDKLLHNCTNPVEKKHIALNGIAELHNLLNVQGELNINGIEVLPAKGETREILV